MISLETYNQIKNYSKPVFLVFLIIFFVKEIILIIGAPIFIRHIPDILFLLIFLEYVILEYLPIFKPEFIDGYEPEEPIMKEEMEEEELDPLEKELKELEDISL